MTRYVSLTAVAALAFLSILAFGEPAIGDVPAGLERQEEPKFGVTQKYCLSTGNSMIRSAAAKAFDAVDGHIGGLINQVQFEEDCAGDFSFR